MQLIHGKTEEVFSPQHKLLWHGDRVKQWLERDRTYPVLIEIAPTGYCNASCPWCFFKDKQNNEHITRETMLRVIDDLFFLGLKAINWSGGGEPTLHPNFAEFVEYAHSKGFKQGLFTNAYKEIPHQEMFSWIRISLTDKGYDKLVIPTVPFGICVNQTVDYMQSELREMCLKARKIGASYFQIRPALVGNYKFQPKIDAPNFLEQYQTEDFKVHVTTYKYEEATKAKDYEECYGYHFCPSIDWHGNLTVCLYLTLDKDYILGNLNTTSLLEIWNKIPKFADVIDKCQNCCKNHEINRFLYRTKYITLEDFL